MFKGNQTATCVLTSTGAFLVGLVFAGLSAAGTWHLLARIAPSNEAAVSLKDWRSIGNDYKSFFFELQDSSGNIIDLSVPEEAWSQRFRLSRSDDLCLRRSRLGGLAISLIEYDNPLSDLIPKGGILEQLLSDEADEVEAKEPHAEFDLLIPAVGAILTATLAMVIWFSAVFGLAKAVRHGSAKLEAAAYGLGSIAGAMVIFLWLA